MRKIFTLLFVFAFNYASYAQSMCGTAAEGGSITLTAPTGMVFTSVMFASYGTPNGSCGAFTTSSCHATNSSSVVSAAFLNKNTATIGADNNTFGDPCAGTVKRLYIQLAYSTLAPLKLTAFTADKQADGKVQLSWLTNDEINTKDFLVQQSEDGIGFTTVGAIAALGKASNTYSFNVSAARSPVTYYRLQMRDVDGAFTFSNILRVNNAVQGLAALGVYPNPVKSNFAVNGLSAHDQLRVYDQNGRLLQQLTANATVMNVDVTGYAKGMYVLQVITSKGTFSQKLLKE